ncbi:expressed unknown protein [Seminavis robusta]|uniref:Uncharacterized protein n=1 Tax=Seminavis robusta TaxID=568900 RepID=A0A9N8HWU4_9STRA|nr:expressed unknown protein [Seminavis robusta]|eukprot:Sro2794_g337280.1 n/a (345) ;mRNA; r:6161-7195
MWSPFGETKVYIPLSLDEAMYEHPRADNGDESSSSRSWKEPTCFDTSGNSSGEETENNHSCSMDLFYEDSEEFFLELGEIRGLLRDEIGNGDVTEVLMGLKALADHLRPENRNAQCNINHAFNAGAPHVVVNAMGKWHSSAPIQTVACCCIFYLAYDFNASGDVIAKARRMDLAKAKGLEAVVTAMKTFPESKPIRFSGCGAMMKLIPVAEKLGERRNSVNSNAIAVAVHNATRRCVEDLDGISVLTETMNMFPDYGGLQSVCLEALCKLASHEEFKAAAMRDYVVEAVAATLETHGEDESISVRQHATCFLLKSMMANQRATRRKSKTTTRSKLKLASCEYAA